MLRKASSRARRFHVEGLEPRALLAIAAVQEFPIHNLPMPGTFDLLSPITRGPDGNLWFTEANSGKVGEINPRTHMISEFALSGAKDTPLGIVAGPDGNVWFTVANDTTNKDYIGEINPSSPAISEFPLPGVDPVSITAGPDGNLWFTGGKLNGIGYIGEIDRTSHFVNEIRIPGTEILGSVTTGPDGNLYFTALTTGATGVEVGVFNPTDHAFSRLLDLPAGTYFRSDITAGPDGNIWIALGNQNKIDVVNPANHAVSVVTLPTGNGVIGGLTVGPNGNLWFTGTSGNKVSEIGEIDRTTHAISEFPIPAPGLADFIATGSDGNLWFTDPLNSKIGEAVFVPPPTVQSVARLGIHMQPTTLVLSFSGPLNAATAQDVANYQIVGPDGQAIAVQSAVYDSATDTVTLKPVHRLDLHKIYMLTVKGTGQGGVTGAFGDLLDGANDGQAGSDFVTPVSAANLRLSSVPGGPIQLTIVRRKVAQILARQRFQPLMAERHARDVDHDGDAR
jgi:streptogramin lyase